MSVENNNIEDNNTSNFSNIETIVLGVLLAALFIGGLCYYFISNKKPSEQPVQEVIEENKETKPQPKINNEYIPVIDCSWLNTLFFIIFSIVIIIFDGLIISEFKKGEENFIFLLFFVALQVAFFLLWFILMLIFAALSKIRDRKHSWWSNVKKGFLRNRIYFKGDYFWTFWLLAIVVDAVIGGLLGFFVLDKVSKIAATSSNPKIINVVNNTNNT